MPSDSKKEKKDKKEKREDSSSKSKSKSSSSSKRDKEDRKEKKDRESRSSRSSSRERRSSSSSRHRDSDSASDEPDSSMKSSSRRASSSKHDVIPINDANQIVPPLPQQQQQPQQQMMPPISQQYPFPQQTPLSSYPSPYGNIASNNSMPYQSYQFQSPQAYSHQYLHHQHATPTSHSFPTSSFLEPNSSLLGASFTANHTNNSSNSPFAALHQSTMQFHLSSPLSSSYHALREEPSAMLPLTEEFKAKMAILKDKMDATLITKKDQLLTQIMAIESRMNEVKNAKRSIEQETLQEAEAIISRLNAVEQKKLSILQSEMDELKRHVNDISKFINYVTAINNAVGSSGSPQSAAAENCAVVVEFLRKFKDHMVECDYFFNIPHKSKIEVRADDFEHETRDKQRMCESYQELLRLLEAKNKIIQELTEERNKIKQSRDAEVAELVKLYQATRQELNEWIKLNDHYYDKLQMSISR